MTKNYQNSEKMAPSNPQSPQEQVMDFINNLGDQMEEAFSQAASSPQTERGDQSTSNREARAQGNPPSYDQPEQTSESSAHANRGGNGGEHRGRHQWGGGPWGYNWREQADPWVQMASNLAESFSTTSANGPPHPGMFFGGGGPGGPGGPGSCHGGRGGGRGGRGGFGGFGGGRGSYHGPWGWGSHRARWGNRGGHYYRNDNGSPEFIPPVDLFDTPNSFVVHVALPGAIKEDIGINYDFDNAELQISGVVHRPGNEEFQKHLVDGERSIGVFDRKIKLESNGKVVFVDADSITAKLENGLLEVTVPKLRKADEPEKKKINIE